MLLACSGALPLSLGLIAVAVRAETPTEVLPHAPVLSDPAAGVYQLPSLENSQADSAAILLIEGKLSLEPSNMEGLLLLREDSATASETAETVAGEGLSTSATASSATASSATASSATGANPPESAATASQESLPKSSESAVAADALNSEPLEPDTPLENASSRGYRRGNPSGRRGA